MWFTAEQLWQYTRASAVWRRFREDNSRIKDHLWIIGNITFQGLYKASNVTLFQWSGKRNNQKILNGTLDFPLWWTTEWKDFCSNDIKFAHQPIQGNVLEKTVESGFKNVTTSYICEGVNLAVTQMVDRTVHWINHFTGQLFRFC